MDTERSDRDLLAGLEGDPRAFEVFYRRHVDRVVGFSARRLREPADVADAVAATFLAVRTSAAGFDPERGEPIPWLLGICSHVIAGIYRRADREQALEAKIAGRRLLDDDDIERLEQRIAAEQSAPGLMRAAAGLRPREREALLLVGVEGLTPAQAARVLGISAANFRMRLTAARRAMNVSLRATGTSDDGRPVEMTEDADETRR